MEAVKGGERNSVSPFSILRETSCACSFWFFTIQNSFPFILTIEEIKLALRKNAIVQYADIIDVDSLKSKENLKFKLSKKILHDVFFEKRQEISDYIKKKLHNATI